MPDVPGGSSRRSQRRTEPREWSALDTPVGFERCVRATLRELYGYVALLAGRDRREAERHVADVYRSLYRAARADGVEAVSLGALRSAARRTWLAEHRDELAATDEVSRAPASTIAELAALERAVIVLRHVNGMTIARSAAELGRTEREVSAIEVHAVRRLRGTDDTSGAWLRAYLGPSVTPAPRLVDRIVDQLGDPPVAEPPDGGSRADDPGAGTGLDEVESEEDQPAETETAVDPAESNTAGELDAGDEDAAPATTELAVVERPTLELAVVTPEPVGDQEQMSAGGPGSPGPVEPTGRPRWALVVGGVLLVALVVALVWLVVRGDADDTVTSTPNESTPDESTPDESTPDESTPDESTPDESPGAGDATSDDTARADSGPGDASSDDTARADSVDTASSSTVAAGPVELGFDPACAERQGPEPTSVSWSTSFGPLGPEPTLAVGLPVSVDVTAESGRRPPGTTALLRPDGLVLGLRPAASHPTSQTVVARVGLDGTVAWVRCVDGSVEIGAAPEVGVDLAFGAAGIWTRLSLADGAPGDQLDAVETAVLDATDPDAGDPDAGDPDAGATTLGYSYDSGLGRSVLAGLDDGSVVWRAPGLVVPDDGFRAAAIGDTVVAQHCATDEPADDETSDDEISEAETSEAETSDDGDDGVADCAVGELRGYDLATGALRWTRPGVHRVAAAGDGHALVGDTTSWELLDVTMGQGVDGQRWDDPDVFPAADEESAVVRDGGALVVRRPGSVEVWLPADVTVDTAAADLP